MTDVRCLYCDQPAKHGRLCAGCLADQLAADDDEPYEEPAFECAGYNDGTGFYCPLWGSEECDWECPRGGMG
jgi:hypothetical protein